MQGTNLVDVWEQARPYLGNWRDPPSYSCPKAVEGWIGMTKSRHKLVSASRHLWLPEPCARGRCILGCARIELKRVKGLLHQNRQFWQTDAEFKQEVARKASECDGGLRASIGGDPMAWLRPGYGSGSSSDDDPPSRTPVLFLNCKRHWSNSEGRWVMFEADGFRRGPGDYSPWEEEGFNSDAWG